MRIRDEGESQAVLSQRLYIIKAMRVSIVLALIGKSVKELHPCIQYQRDIPTLCYQALVLVNIFLDHLHFSCYSKKQNNKPIIMSPQAGENMHLP